MPRDVSLAEVLQDLYDSRATGAYCITVKESSEDMFRIYTKGGEIVAVTYGPAVGQDAIDILEHYTLVNGTLFEGTVVPDGVAPFKFPMKKFIEMMHKVHKKIRVP